MLKKPTIITHESRPIERRGKKRASPLIEMSLSYREEVISTLMSLQEYIENGIVSFGAQSEIDVEELLTNMGHAIKQKDFKRRNRQ